MSINREDNSTNIVEAQIDVNDRHNVIEEISAWDKPYSANLYKDLPESIFVGLKSVTTLKRNQNTGRIEVIGTAGNKSHVIFLDQESGEATFEDVG